MGMDLVNRQDSYRHLSRTVWAHLLCLAYRYGWEAEGTHATDVDCEGDKIEGERYQRHDEDWQSRMDVPESYSSNDDQIVSAEDAEGLAIALERALLDIPDENRLAEREKMSDPNYFSGDSKWLVQDFISFCREGAFHIR